VRRCASGIGFKPLPDAGIESPCFVGRDAILVHKATVGTTSKGAAVGFASYPDRVGIDVDPFGLR
jgi:hypothetical protein